MLHRWTRFQNERGEVEDEALGARRMPRPSPAGDLDPVALEGDLLKRWSEEGAFEASIEARRGGAPFIFLEGCLLYTSPSPRDKRQSRMPSSA